MFRYVWLVVLLAVSGVLVSPELLAAEPNSELMALQNELNDLEAHPSLRGLASAERILAKQAVQAVEEGKRRQRPHLIKLAKAKVALARAAAEAAHAAQQQKELVQERDRLKLALAQKEAEQARLEAERLRLQTLAQAEEFERTQMAMAQAQAEREDVLATVKAARQEAKQARNVASVRNQENELAKMEAELAMSLLQSSLDAGEAFVIPGDVFASGKATLSSAADVVLDDAVNFLQASNRAAVVEGHTDAQGNDASNRALSQKRAQAVVDALVARGVSAARLSAVGRGEGEPIALNSTAQGRAKNRRVLLLLK